MPSDIISRSGFKNFDNPESTGFRPADLVPPVDPNPVTRADAFNNTLGTNLSSSLGLGAGSDDNPFEDARAHRGIVRGDFVFLGWSWTPDWAVARYTDLENYNFFTRRSFDGGLTWTDSQNMSNIEDTLINVKEPRIIATPFSPDPNQPTNLNVVYVGWGTEVNQYEHVAEFPIPLDIVITRTSNQGESYSPVQEIAGGEEGQFEAQLRTNAAGTDFYAVWQEAEADGSAVNTLFRYAYVEPQVEPQIVVPASFDVTAGNLGEGGLKELNESDNVDLQILRSSSDIESRTWIEMEAVSPVATPEQLDITLEGAVFARTRVDQSIELWDYDLDDWELIDTRTAATIIDATATVSPTGDLSRFVEAGTGAIRARVKYFSVENPRQAFSSNTDLFTWTIFKTR